MGKRIITLLLIVVAFTLSSCGKTTIETMNEDEKKLYDLLCEKAQNFYSPTSVKLLKASDIMSINTKEEYEGFVLSHFSDGNLFYSPHYWGRQYKLEKIQLVAETNGGGSDNKVYCINIEKNPNAIDYATEEKYKFKYDRLGAMWSYDDYLEEIKEPYDDGSLEAEKNIAIQRFSKEAAKLYALEHGLNGLAESGEYPISSGTKIDVAKINKALDEHWQEMGIK